MAQSSACLIFLLPLCQGLERRFEPPRVSHEMTFHALSGTGLHCQEGLALYKGGSRGQLDCEGKCYREEKCRYYSFWESTSFCHLTVDCDKIVDHMDSTVKIYKKLSVAKDATMSKRAEAKIAKWEAAEETHAPELTKKQQANKDDKKAEKKARKQMAREFQAIGKNESKATAEVKAQFKHSKQMFKNYMDYERNSPQNPWNKVVQGIHGLFDSKKAVSKERKAQRKEKQAQKPKPEQMTEEGEDPYEEIPSEEPAIPEDA